MISAVYGLCRMATGAPNILAGQRCLAKEYRGKGGHEDSKPIRCSSADDVLPCATGCSCPGALAIFARSDRACIHVADKSAKQRAQLRRLEASRLAAPRGSRTCRAKSFSAISTDSWACAHHRSELWKGLPSAEHGCRHGDERAAAACHRRQTPRSSVISARGLGTSSDRRAAAAAGDTGRAVVVVFDQQRRSVGHDDRHQLHDMRARAAHLRAAHGREQPTVVSQNSQGIACTAVFDAGAGEAGLPRGEADVAQHLFGFSSFCTRSIAPCETGGRCYNRRLCARGMHSRELRDERRSALASCGFQRSWKFC